MSIAPENVRMSASISLMVFFVALGPLWAGKVKKGNDAPATLKITKKPTIEVDENWHSFVSPNTYDKFDPFWDDQLIGGIGSLGGGGLQHFKYVTNANATTASTNQHIANVEFNLTVAATVEIAVYRDYTWPYSNVLVQDISGTPYSCSAGQNAIGHWRIDDEEPGDYFANVCAWTGTIGQAGYQEVGGGTTEKPLSPSSQNTRTSADTSSSFYIERRPWGSTRNIQFVTEELTGGGFTDTQWVLLCTAGGVTTSVAAALIATVSGVAATLPELAVATGWLALNSVDFVNGVIPSLGQPAGLRRKTPTVPGDENDVKTTKTWTQDVWEWKNASDAKGQYQKWYDSGTVVETGSWEYSDYRRPTAGASGHGYSWVDWAGFSGSGSRITYWDPASLGYMVGTFTYWMPPDQQGTASEVVYFPVNAALRM